MESFRGFPSPVTLVAIAGKNSPLEARCRRLAQTLDSPELVVRVRGFVPNMAEWMGASDVVVTKPGGLTLVEALGVGRPLILLPARGGQEEINRRWAVAAGAAVNCPEPHLAGSLLRGLFSDSGGLAGMGAASVRAGRPEAAGLISREIVETLFPDNMSERRIS